MQESIGQRQVRINRSTRCLMIALADPEEIPDPRDKLGVRYLMKQGGESRNLGLGEIFGQGRALTIYDENWCEWLVGSASPQMKRAGCGQKLKKCRAPRVARCSSVACSDNEYPLVCETIFLRSLLDGTLPITVSKVTRQ